MLSMTLNNTGSQDGDDDEELLLLLLQAPMFLWFASVGSMNLRYLNQSQYKHMPYMCSTLGMFSHGEAPYVSYVRMGYLCCEREEQFCVYISNLTDSLMWFSTCVMVRCWRLGWR
jgi:hypothetical protein